MCGPIRKGLLIQPQPTIAQPRMKSTQHRIVKVCRMSRV